jgi:hypothetical protein
MQRARDCSGARVQVKARAASGSAHTAAALDISWMSAYYLKRVINEWNLALICRDTADSMISQGPCVALPRPIAVARAPAGGR